MVFQQRGLRVPSPPSIGVIVKLSALFVLLTAAAASNLALHGLQRQPVPEQTPIWSVPGGEAARGARAIRHFGCGGCHSISGLRFATGTAGPPLEGFANRVYIAGRLPNTPEHLAAWIQSPGSIDPQTAMPDLGVSSAEARDIAAYLYSLPR